ncbi:MAG: hypothetical protein ABWZ88_05330 [Variovorax sp.]
MTTIQARRQLIVIVLLCLAVGGGVVRYFAAPSTFRDIATLLMLLWLPVIGNVIAWLVGKWRRPPPPAAPSFGPAADFSPHARVELTLRPAAVPVEDTRIAEGEHRCSLVIGNDGFSVRWFVAPGDVVRRGQPHALDIEFLAPAVALPRFQPTAAFRMLVGPAFVGDGRVLEVLA